MASSILEKRSWLSSVPQKHHGFLCFRGKDTRYTFISHLREGFKREGIKTFTDNQLDKGEEITPALLKKIEESMFSIVVLSENFASSPWCLDEVVKILDCKKRNKQIVVPIFYNVDPSDIQNIGNIGSFAEAFEKHQECFENTRDKYKVERWKAPLVELSNLAGYHYQIDRSEAEFISDVVKHIWVRVKLNMRPSIMRRYEMLKKECEDDDELGPAEWSTVKRYIPSLNILDPTNLEDIRIHHLNCVKADYRRMLDVGMITQTTANLLMQSVDEATDLVSHEPLCDWKGLIANVRLPSYYKFLHMRIFPQKLVTCFAVKKLESACWICAAFLRAHRIARQQLHDYIGGSDIASKVINESKAEGEEAQTFLEAVREVFPQVLHIVKIRQRTYLVLNHLIHDVQNLGKVGSWEEKEMFHFHDALQTDLKKLPRNLPSVRIPKISDLISDLISDQPLLRNLPSAVREALESSIKTIKKLRGVTLYKEGSKANAVCLITSGDDKLTSESRRNKHSLHPTFAHESTLGLYAVLIGKPIIADSVVRK